MKNFPETWEILLSLKQQTGKGNLRGELVNPGFNAVAAALH
jgi:hypothetical protein